MTRETKIGLFVGMGVIILIGILISDHLAKVADQKPAPLPDTIARIQPETQPPVPGSLNSSVPPAIVTTPSSGTPVHDLVAPPPVSQLTPPASAPDTPVTLNQGQTPPGSFIAEAGKPGISSAPPGAVVGGDPLVASGQFERVRTDSGVGATTTLTPAPKQTIHFVREGETLSEISRQHFGDRIHIQAIYDANKDKMSSIHSLRPGVRLVIPASKLEASVEMTSPAGTVPIINATSRSNATLVDYKIQEGETLSTIAEKIYGSKSAWQKLYALNKERVPNPNRMKLGTVISVPKNP